MLVVKCNLVSRGTPVSSEVPVRGSICKDFGANASSKMSLVSVINRALYVYVRVTRVCVPTTIVQL